jgi:hypothetical protein
LGQPVPRISNYRCRHLPDDWHPLDLPELFGLYERADLLLGVDSGPLHFARFSRVPALGLWTHHSPCGYAPPREDTAHLVPSKDNHRSRHHRLAYQIVEGGGDRLTAGFILEQARCALAPRKFVPHFGRDLLLQHLLDRCQGWDSPMTSWVDRHCSFPRFFGALPAGPVRILETGTMRQGEDFPGAGASTLLFGILAAGRGGTLTSLDHSPENCATARFWTHGLPVTVVTTDSLE